VSDEYTPEMMAMLERQRAYFSSDECLRDRAELWRDASPEECWAAVEELCADAEALLSQLDDETRERAMRPEPLPPRVIAMLESMQRPSR